MKYIYTKGPWKEFYGYVFWDGKPTEITDRSTLERIQREADFQLYEESHEETQGQTPNPTPILKGKECPHCHRLIPRGWYFHQLNCKGLQ